MQELLTIFNEADSGLDQYKRVSYAISVAIYRNILVEGNTVPSAVLLSEILDLNKMTTLKGLQHAAKQGLLTHNRGQNFVVAKNAKREAEANAIIDLKVTTLHYLKVVMRHFGFSHKQVREWMRDADE